MWGGEGEAKGRPWKKQKNAIPEWRLASQASKRCQGNESSASVQGIISEDSVLTTPAKLGQGLGFE